MRNVDIFFFILFHPLLILQKGLCISAGIICLIIRTHMLCCIYSNKRKQVNQTQLHLLSSLQIINVVTLYCILLSADLKTMLKRVDSELCYITLEMFIADMKKMFSNARTYNSPETIYYKCATRYDTPFPLILTNCTFLHMLFITNLQVGSTRHEQIAKWCPICCQAATAMTYLKILKRSLFLQNSLGTFLGG